MFPLFLLVALVKKRSYVNLFSSKYTRVENSYFSSDIFFYLGEFRQRLHQGRSSRFKFVLQKNWQIFSTIEDKLYTIGAGIKRGGE